MADDVPWSARISPKVLHCLFTDGYTVVWRAEGGWVVISRRRLWNVFQSMCAETGVGDRWIEQEPPPEPLSASQQQSLNFLLQQPWPMSEETAKALIGGGTEEFRELWRWFPQERKLKRGRPRGRRLSDASAQLLHLRKK